jgi:hypothetical protein
MDQTETPYSELEPLGGFYFEDSYVLDIKEVGDEIIFELELVLTPRHPSYRLPPLGEQHCYQRGTLIFREVRKCQWLSRRHERFVDAEGEVDFGNIDIFFRKGSDAYYLEGDWGSIEVTSKVPPIVLLDTGAANTRKEMGSE